MSVSRPARVCVAVVVAVVLGAPAGCAPFGDGSPQRAAPQDRAGRLLKASEAVSALPSVASLPRGWHRSKNVLRPTYVKDKVTPARCLPLDHGFDEGYLKATAKSYRTYVKGGHAALGIGIASHTEAPPSLASVRAALKTCTTFRAVSKDQRAQVKVLPLRLPELGADTVAARFVMRQAGVTMTYDAIRVRVGHNEILGDLLTPSTEKPKTKPLVTTVRNALLNLS